MTGFPPNLAFIALISDEDRIRKLAVALVLVWAPQGFGPEIPLLRVQRLCPETAREWAAVREVIKHHPEMAAKSAWAL